MSITIRSRPATMGARDGTRAAASRYETIVLTGSTTEFGVPPDVAESIASCAATSGGTTDGRGAPELREAIAQALRVEKNVPIDPERIVVTIGAKEATLATMMALLEPGDEVLLPDPAWVSYEEWIRRCGAFPVRFGMRRQAAFRPDLDEIRAKISQRTRLVIITSPHNPTGVVMRRDEFEGIANVITANKNTLLVSDESNSRIIFDDVQHISPLEIPALAERTIVFRSFSKDYAVPGWRIGYVYSEAPEIEAIRAAHEHAVTCVPTLIQRGALAMLRSPNTYGHIRRYVDALTERREAFVTALNGISGISCHRPEGAFNAFPYFGDRYLSAGDISERLLTEAGLVTVPGFSFGRFGRGHVRMAFTQPSDVLKSAVSRLHSHFSHTDMEDLTNGRRRH